MNESVSLSAFRGAYYYTDPDSCLMMPHNDSDGNENDKVFYSTLIMTKYFIQPL